MEVINLWRKPIGLPMGVVSWRQKKDKRDFEKRVREIVAEMVKESESAAAEQESLREILEDDTVV
jgi:hypothetical protein